MLDKALSDSSTTFTVLAVPRKRLWRKPPTGPCTVPLVVPQCRYEPSPWPRHGKAFSWQQSWQTEQTKRCSGRMKLLFLLPCIKKTMLFELNTTQAEWSYSSSLIKNRGGCCPPAEQLNGQSSNLTTEEVKADKEPDGKTKIGTFAGTEWSTL